MMAIAHGYVAGKVGVAMTGSGPGVTNAITGVHVAWDSGYPLLLSAAPRRCTSAGEVRSRKPTPSR